MIKKLIFLFFLGFVFLNSCYYDNEEELYPFEAQCEVPETVSYMEDVEPIISGNCAVSNCHVSGGTSGAPSFTTYNEVQGSVDNFNEKVFNGGEMAGPGFGNITDCQVQILEKWVEQGAQNN